MHIEFRILQILAQFRSARVGWIFGFQKTIFWIMASGLPYTKLSMKLKLEMKPKGTPPIEVKQSGIFFFMIPPPYFLKIGQVWYAHSMQCRQYFCVRSHHFSSGEIGERDRRGGKNNSPQLPLPPQLFRLIEIAW